MNDFISQAKIPPQNPDDLASKLEIAESLAILVGKRFPLTRKARTDGSNFRKLVTNTLMQNTNLTPLPANEDEFNILPPKGKGVPSFLRQYIDTYIVTTGDSYNLQVWNRNPNSDHVQIEYLNGNSDLLAKDVTFVFGKINSVNEIIDSIIVAKPQDIVERFGYFGVPTSKQQLIISNNTRKRILDSPDRILFFPDEPELASILNPYLDTSYLDLKSNNIQEIIPLTSIYPIIKDLIGTQLLEQTTKQKGQELERIVASALGYNIPRNMEGGYPDIPNQMLEIKVQDSPTVDLGRYSPQNLENISGIFNTRNIRYLIALTNSTNNMIEGFYLGSGANLGKHFSYVSDKSVKYQRGISMNFFEQFSGKSIALY